MTMQQQQQFRAIVEKNFYYIRPASGIHSTAIIALMHIILYFICIHKNT
jgi:hypothetical protein